MNFFNVVLNSGCVPSDWCIGLLQPIFKNKGSPNNPDNYRGITLLSCFGKLFTACINTRLSSFIANVGILGEEQAGFRPGYSSIDHIFVMSSLIELYLHKHERIYCAFVDFKKAFDLVDRTSLWSKLISCNINGKILNVIYNLYKNAKSCVKQGNMLSEFFTCNIGVRQGENLSPLLFAIYLNDLEGYISKECKGLKTFCEEIRTYLSDDDIEVFVRLFVLLYADDTILVSESADDLNKALSALYTYCDDWKLAVNTTKTKVVIFSRGLVKKYPNFTFGNTILEVVPDYVYLGCTLNYNGTFNKAINKQVCQARRAMFALTTKARRLHLPVDIQCELFDKMVTPILLYGSEYWGFNCINQIEIFVRKFLKNVLHLPKATPNCIVYGETGRFPLQLAVEKK